MEPWRLIATTLLAVGGIVLVLVTMAKVRDRADSHGPVALSGAVALTVLVLLCVLTATVLPAAVAWGAVLVVGAVVSVMLLAG